jgi:hypothetical protein
MTKKKPKKKSEKMVGFQETMQKNFDFVFVILLFAI